MKTLRVLLCLIMAIFLVSPLSLALERPMESVDYWQRNYDELRPEDDPRARMAHEIFNRLAGTAGSRPGLIPRLFIVRSEPKNVSLPIVIPDGSVIISTKTLDICFKDKNLGKDRLAFILGHELAHLFKDDFWHMKFFNAIKTAEAEKTSDSRLLEEIRQIVGSTDQVLAKELQADEFGIVYASMAGFNTRAIVAEDEKFNFFIDWLKSYDPAYSENAPKDPSHPTPEQRAETVRTRLRQVLKNVDVYDLGLSFYQTGQFERAILAFQRFLTYFPSREVYHNLAASHHQMALKYYRMQEGAPDPLFRMSLAIDPHTRANAIIVRGAEDPKHLYAEHLKEAIGFYHKAIAQDPGYVYSYNNLACALILRGEEGDAYKAIGLLRDSLKIEPAGKDTLNSLGVAFYYAENPAKARDCFLEANRLDPTYELPLFNLGRLALELGKENECRLYWSKYIELDGHSQWAGPVRKFLGTEEVRSSPSNSITQGKEKVLGLEIGAYDEDVSKDWGSPGTESISFGRARYRINAFPNQVVTVSESEEIQLIKVLSGFEGKTGRDIGIGESKENVISRYGPPARILETRGGFCLFYESFRMVFIFSENRLASWILF
ncbi:MAG: tetratricopeptide repeat protein [Syntrophobacteraceae bacterium]